MKMKASLYMHKRVILIFLSVLTMIISLPEETIDAKSKKATFILEEEVFDYGAQITKIIIKCPESVIADSININTFDIEIQNVVNNDIVESSAISLTNIYVSNTRTGMAKKEGKYIILELQKGKDVEITYSLWWEQASYAYIEKEMSYNLYQNNSIKTVAGDEINFEYEQGDIVNSQADKFTTGKSTSGLQYRDYQPKDDGKKHPLIIWLHGAGKGGDNNVSQILADKGAVSFVGSDAQKQLDNPYVLVPQCPDFWVDLTLGDIFLDGNNHTDALLQLIEEYLDQHDNIDKNRVYIGGYSMGGYQTWETILAKPELFAAAFPICAAYEVSNDKLSQVVDIPIWMFHTETDNVISVATSRNTYEALYALGGNVIYTEFVDNIVDGVTYEPHEAWVWITNNIPKNKDGKSFYAWLISQKQENEEPAIEKPKEKVKEQSNAFVYIIIGSLLTGILGLVIYVIRKRK
ncbi:prolyl oligopeptidase family serine peptidase [Breznakia sp. OttesenSCG-928-G09]|nr:prolyl oligopeptidase family serine peptidase [Breznakia sp. OttesenSCG-928-G09]